MAQSAALLVLPSGLQDSEKKDGQSATLLAAQVLEDLCLADRVVQALRASGHPTLRTLEVTACRQLVILKGRVPSYYVKQLAQVVAMEVVGVQDLLNELQVVQS
jgi:osmotically-inducible protein OsmY